MFIEQRKAEIMTLGSQKYARAMLLRESALEVVRRHGAIERIQNAGIGLTMVGNGFSVWYTDPETAECDELHHLDIHLDGSGKVFSVVWKSEEAPEVVTFKRGTWEDYFLS